MLKSTLKFLLLTILGIAMATMSYSQCSMPSGTAGATPQTYAYNIAVNGTANILTFTPDGVSTGATLYVNGGFNSTITGSKPYVFGTALTNGASTTFYVLYTISGIGGNQQTSTYTFIAGGCATAPTVQASNISTYAKGPTKASIICTKGNGAYRLIVLSTNASDAFVPVDGTLYTGAAAFTGGAVLSGTTASKAVYAGLFNKVDVTGLIANTTYYVRVYEYNGTKYLASSPATASFTTTASGTTPTVSAPTITNGTVVNSRYFYNTGSSTTVTMSNTPTAGTGTITSVDYYDFDNNTNTYSKLATSTSASAPYTYSWSGMNPSLHFVYAVATDANGNGTAGAQSTVSITPPPPVNSNNWCAAGGFNGNTPDYYCKMSSTATGYTYTVTFHPVTACTSVSSNNSLTGATVLTYSAGTGDWTGTFTSATGTLTYGFTYVIGGITYATTSGAHTYTANTTCTYNAAPTTGASAIAFTLVTGTTATVSCTSGNGTGRVIIMRAGSPVDLIPNGANAYTPNANFTTATGYGPTVSSKVVYFGTSNTVNVTGLIAGTTYYVSVYEYNTSSTYNYTYTASASTANITTTGVIITSPIAGATYYNGASIPLKATAGASSPYTIASVVFKDNGTTTIGTGVLGSDNTYSYTWTGAANGSHSITAVATDNNATPTVTTSTAVAITVATSSPPAGFCGTASSSTNPTPALPDYAWKAAQDANGYIIWTFRPLNRTIGSGNTSVVVNHGMGSTSLVKQGNGDWDNSAAPYNYACCTFANFGFAYTIGDASSTSTTGFPSGVHTFTKGTSCAYYSAPTTAASNITFPAIGSTTMTISCTSGNGTSRLIVMRAASAVDFTPADGNAYTANSNFAAATGYGNTLTSKVVYSGTSNTVNVTGLTSGTLYYVTVYEYNGVASTSYTYLTTGAPTASATAGAPTVTITAPTASQTFAAPGPITLTATVTSPGSTINNVQFYANNGTTNTLVGTGTFTSGTSYSYSWTGVAVGSYTITAVATDNNSSPLSTTSSGVSITVSNIIVPAVSVTSPTASTTYYNPGASIILNATASTTDGTVNSVQFYANNSTTNNLIGSGALISGNTTSGTYTYTWSGMTNGVYSITAVATGSNTGVATSAPVSNITIATSAAPTVSLNAPTNGTSYYTNANITITAIASAATTRTIANVKIYAGATLLATLTSSPYTYTWTGVANGSYTLTAVATDNVSSSTTSSSIAITVVSPPPNGYCGSGGVGGATDYYWSAYTTHTIGNTINITWHPVSARALACTTVTWTTNGPPTVTTTKQSNGDFTGSFDAGGVNPTTFGFIFKDASGNTYTTPNGTFSYATDANCFYYATPTVPASNITFPAKGTTTLTVACTVGDGTNRLIVVRQGSATDFVPVDGQSYTANSNFGAGTAVGTASKVVYAGTSNTVDISGLTANNLYYVTIFEFNGTTGFTKYLTTGATGSTTTYASAPAVSLTSPAPGFYFTASNILISATASSTTGSIATVQFYAKDSATGTNNLINTFSGAGPYNFTWTGMAVNAYDITARAIDNQGSATTSAAVRIRVVATPPANYCGSGGAGGATDYYWSATTTHTIGNTVVMTWHPVSTRALATTSVTWTTNQVSPAMTKQANGDWTASFDAGGVNPTTFGFTFNDGAGNTLTTANGTFTYYRDNTCNYYATPTIPASNITFPSKGSVGLTIACTKGNGTNRLIVVRQGSAVDFVPVDGTSYTANTDFNAGTTVGTGCKVVYNGTGNSVDISGLTANTLYYVTIYEFNGNTTFTKYLTVSAPVSSTTTYLSSPTVALTSPANNSSYFTVESIPLSATASSTTGTIASVQFYANDGTTTSLIDIVTTSPYNTTWSGMAAGSYTITAKAIDDQGSATTSSAVNVAVLVTPPDGYCGSGGPTGFTDYYWKATNVGNIVTWTFHPVGRAIGGTNVILNANVGNPTMTKNPTTGDWTYSLDVGANTTITFGFTYTLGTTGNPQTNTANNTHTYVKGNNCVYCPASSAAVLSGTSTICQPNNANLSVAIAGGVSPFTVVYNNGTTNVTVNNYVSGANIPVSPTSNTSYTLVSVTGSCGTAGTGLSGSATVTVTPKYNISNETTIACSGVMFNFTPSDGTAGMTYSWTVPAYSGSVSGGTAQSAQSSITGTLTNGSVTAGTATYTVTPLSSGNCAGNPFTVAVTVDPKLTPSVTTAITSGSNPTCQGGNVTFTATPVNGGTTPGYQWYKNGTLVVGATNSTYTVASPASVYVVMTTSLTCYTSATATSSTTTLTTKDNSWTGAVSTSWSTGANWCSGAVPTGTTNIVIPTGLSRYPLITGSYAVHDIEIQAGATVNLNNQQLTISGIIEGTGKFKGSPASKLIITTPGAIGTLYMDPSANVLGSLVQSTPSSTLTLGSATNVYGELNTGSGTLNTGGNLTLKSTISGTAWVAPITGSGSITGAVTVERYIPYGGHRGWRMMSIPTMGSQTINAAWQEGQQPMANGNPGYGTLLTKIGGGSGYDAASTGNSLLTLTSGVPGTYSGVPSTTAAIATTSGYMVYIRGDRSAALTGGPVAQAPTTLRTNGPLYQGTQSAIMVSGGANKMVGNIYASAIDFVNITKTGITSFRLWDPKLLGTSNLGGYQTFSFTNGYVPIPGGGSYGATPNTRIQSGQAFIISSSNGSITLTEACKVSGSNNSVFRASGMIKQLKMNLLLANSNSNDLADGSSVVFNDDFDNAVDDNDAAKINNLDENIGIKNGSAILTIEARKNVLPGDIIQLQLEGLKPKNYELSLQPENLDLSIPAYLEDKYLNTKTPISFTKLTEYNFTVNADAASSAADRFRIVFSKEGISAPVKFAIVKSLRKNSEVEVGWNISDEGAVKQYNVERSLNGNSFEDYGTVTANRRSGEANYTWMDVKPYVGDVFYRIKSIGLSGEAKYTGIAKVSGINNNDFTIKPNPVTGSIIKLELKNSNAGKYKVRLLNNIGQPVLTTSFIYEGDAGDKTINLDGRITNGLYQVELTNPVGQRSFKTVIISNDK